ncbi:MAG: PspA-associated protein PspAB [Sulfobacillus sp.]
MGFFDSLFGRTKIPSGKTDQLFALSTALLDIETRLSTPFAKRAGVVLRTVDNSSYESIEKDVNDVLHLGGKDIPVTARHVDDAEGFRWILLEGEQADDVINAMHLTADLTLQAGYGDSLLAAMFDFGSWYLIYSYRRGTFYPFVPTSRRERNEAREFRISETLKPYMPIEKDPERRYALWDPPF